MSSDAARSRGFSWYLNKYRRGLISYEDVYPLLFNVFVSRGFTDRKHIDQQIKILIGEIDPVAKIVRKYQDQYKDAYDQIFNYLIYTTHKDKEFDADLITRAILGPLYSEEDTTLPADAYFSRYEGTKKIAIALQEAYDLAFKDLFYLLMRENPDQTAEKIKGEIYRLLGHGPPQYTFSTGPLDVDMTRSRRSPSPSRPSSHTGAGRAGGAGEVRAPSPRRGPPFEGWTFWGLGEERSKVPGAHILGKYTPEEIMEGKATEALQNYFYHQLLELRPQTLRGLYNPENERESAKRANESIQAYLARTP
jgi:hypothetical protein